MKTKINKVLFFLIVFTIQYSFSQTKIISGTITDDLGPISDVSVLVKGNDETGTVTDFDGNYSINAKTGDILVFSHVSYQNTQKTVGASNVIDVILSSAGNQLQEVIVTAFGVKKKKTNDLSSSTTIDITEIEKSGESGLLQGLAGKTSGVAITKTSGDPGAGSFIQIRGANSVLNSNAPLIVIDGVLISNTNSGNGVAGVVAQSRLNDIPSSDIESVTILKGAQAAALYGSGASNGVIVMTTKSGRASGGKKWQVSISNSTQIEQINEEWDLQSTYGQGIDGRFFDSNTQLNGFSFGDKIADRSGEPDVVNVGNLRFEALDGSVYYPITQKNSRDVFTRSNRDLVLGDGFTNEIQGSVSYNGENGTTFLSITNWDQTGVINNGSNYERTTFRFNNTTKLSDKLSVSVNTTYIDADTDGVQRGSNTSGLYLGYLRNTPDFDISDYIGTAYNSSGDATQNAQRSYRSPYGTTTIYNNPLWTINRQSNLNKLSRFIINPSLTYAFSDNLSFTTRYSIDSYTDKDTEFFPTGGSAELNGDIGHFRKDATNSSNQYFYAGLNGNKEFNSNFNINWLIGTSYEKSLSEFTRNDNNDFINPFITLDDVSSLGNGISTVGNQSVLNNINKTAKSAVFASVDTELYNQILIGATGRLERSSTLIDDTFFYPSASIGWKFTELMVDNASFLNFGKIRVAYGEVATEPRAYRGTTPFVSDLVASTWGDQISGNVVGGTFNLTAELGNPDLTVERVKEIEYGIDLKLFNNKMTFGFTYYDRITEDMLVRQQLATSTGFVSKVTNNGEMTNKGIEADISYRILSNDDFSWSVRLNYSKNDNLVSKLPGGNVFLDGFTGLSAEAVEGEPFSVLLGGAWERNEDGTRVLDDNGFPMLDTTGDKVLGDPNADWRGGFGTSLRYKNFSLSASLETSQGNEVWNGTRGILRNFGISNETANEITVSAEDAVNIVNFQGNPISSLNSATENADGSFTVRGNLEDFGDGVVLLDDRWYSSLFGGQGGGFGDVSEDEIEDASWVKLREITVGYSFPKKWLSPIGISNFDINLSGRNLVTWTDIEGFDPEGSLSGGGNGRGLEYFTNPSTKSYNLTIKFGF